MSRQFGLTVYGTGYTGSLIAKYLLRRAPPSLRWSIAGRDATKLAALHAELVSLDARAAFVGVLCAPPSEVAASATACIAAAGPFALCGEALLAACVEHGTHYADVTGEVAWVRAMRDKYDAAARKSGTFVVSLSGFDSCPSDLGVLFLARAVNADGGKRLSSVTGYARVRGGLSGGTIATALATAADATAARVSSDPLVLCDTRDAVKYTPDPSALSVFTAPTLPGLPQGAVAGVFAMAAINSRLVSASAALFAARGGDAQRYATGQFEYSEYALYPSWSSAIGSAVGLGTAGALLALPFNAGVSLGRALLPAPGTGPDAAARASSSFTLWLVGQVEGGGERVATVSGGDPYEVTAVFAGAAGLLLAKQVGSLPGAQFGGGFLTPATAFGAALVEAVKPEVKFELVG